MEGHCHNILLCKTRLIYRPLLSKTRLIYCPLLCKTRSFCVVHCYAILGSFVDRCYAKLVNFVVVCSDMVYTNVPGVVEQVDHQQTCSSCFSHAKQHTSLSAIAMAIWTGFRSV